MIIIIVGYWIGQGIDFIECEKHMTRDELLEQLQNEQYQSLLSHSDNKKLNSYALG